MNESHRNIFEVFERQPQLLRSSRHGIEREALRVDASGKLAATPHPADFGSKLTHPSITTDFGESQLELVTPPLKSESAAVNYLRRLHRVVYEGLDSGPQKELLWPASTPCSLPKASEIRLAEYGTSETGRLKTLYRSGLGHRYGRKMQMLSGIHYNFSIGQTAWKELHAKLAPSSTLKDFRSEAYLGLLRNFLRWGWLNTYLFGSTPVVDRSFFNGSYPELETLSEDTLYAPYATSIRMSDLGYYSKVQAQLAVSFNDLPTYLQDMRHAVSTPHADWAKIPAAEQMNDFLLQSEAEHYSRMRPKPKASSNLRSIDALEKGGIEYVEARSVDISPFDPDGLHIDQLLFLHIFMLHCLCQPSAPIAGRENGVISANQNSVALRGRDPELTLTAPSGQLSLQEWGESLLNAMQPVADLLDRATGNGRYRKGLSRQLDKLRAPEKLPSSRVLKGVRAAGGSQHAYYWGLAQEYRPKLLARACPDSFLARARAQAEQSIADQAELEAREDFVLKGYETLELSTQMVIREALHRGVQVRLLDESDHFISLKKGSRTEYVKMATMTRRDSIVSYMIMENKNVTKHVLQEAGLRAPSGYRAVGRESALQQYSAAGSSWPGRKLVVKPTFTNFGVGITVVEAGDRHGFRVAVDEALRYGQDLIVEEFCVGEEYRFLVIDGKIEAVCQRLAAHVVGDGRRSVRELVRAKNKDPANFKLHKYRIRTGALERGVLAEQGLTFESVPDVGSEAILRRVSNVSTGGDPIDCTDLMHPEWEPIALAAAKAGDAIFCGIDLLTPDIRERPTDSNWAILELNFNPALFLHRYPVRGKPRYVERAVLDALGF